MKLAFSAAFLLTLVASACAQGNEAIEYKSTNVRHLAGSITYMDGTAVRGAVVADCDPTYGHVLASTKTDRNGWFSLPHVKLGSRHFLKVDYPNFDEVRMPVRVWLFGRSSILIQLRVGT